MHDVYLERVEGIQGGRVEVIWVRLEGLREQGLWHWVWFAGGLSPLTCERPPCQESFPAVHSGHCRWT